MDDFSKELVDLAKAYVEAERNYQEARGNILRLYNYLPQYGGVIKIDWARIRDIGRHGAIPSMWKDQINREISITR